jgi:ABC-type phosphate/phosphonate transport system substrate-binding protein
MENCSHPSWRLLTMKPLGLSLFFVLGMLVFGSPGWTGENPQSDPEYVRVAYSSGVFRDVDTRDAQLAIELWTSELSKMVNLKPKAMIFTSLKAIESQIKNREIDLIAVPTLEYLRSKSRSEMEPVLVGMAKDQVGDEFVLLTPGQVGGQLRHLQGKTINIQGSRGAESIPGLWLDALLRRQGLPPSASFFREVREVNKPSQAVLPVLFKKADAAIVTQEAYETLVEMNPQEGKDLTINATSPRYLQTMLVIRKSVSVPLQRRIIEAAINLSTHARGDQILKLFMTSKIVLFKQAYLKGVEELVGKSH